MSDSDTPILARSYKSTIQRIPCDLRQFNSSAAFILACETIKKIFVWVGKNASTDDISLAEAVGFDILRDDYLNIGELVTIREDSEKLQSLEYLLVQLFMKLDDYLQHAPFRSNPLENSPITLSIVERKFNDHGENDFTIKPVSHSTPSGRTGSVPPLPFLSVVDRKTIAVLTTGNQYDIW